MKIKTLLIDDEPIALEKLKGYVGKTPFLELTGVCTSAIEAMDFLASESVDVIFTDINMPDLNGLEFVGSLPKPPMVVFITAHACYAAESYRLSAVDYLLKPYSLNDFQRAANKVLMQYRMTNTNPHKKVSPEDSIFVKTDYRFVRVSLPDIRYIKGYGEYLRIFTTSSETPLMTLSSFSSIKDRLSENFIQIHRSYIVNMNHVEHIERARVVMDKDTYLPVGDSYRTTLQDYLSSYSVGKK